MELALLDRFAGAHHGLVTLSVARRLGVSTSSWYRAIDAGLLEQMYPTVARVFGSPRSFHQRALAAVWMVGPTAMTSHRTSAVLYGVDLPDDDFVDVMLPSRRRRSVPPNIVLHRPRVQHDLRPIVRFGVPTTNPLRMLLDLAAVEESRVESALVHILSSKVASPAAILSAIDRHSIPGRHGTVRLRKALEAVLASDLPPDSELETHFRAFVAKFGLPEVEFHATVIGYEVDFLVVGTTVIVECDGWGTHGLDRDQFEFDRMRDAELVAAGCHVVHVTWRGVMSRSQRVADQLREVLQRWYPEVLG
jgi:very-short-patch-repair endonuclease